uniref:Epsin 1b n=1 Tax=Poecilia formosa TaxID=48698 RepID=A0A087XMC2_POEFO
MTSSMLRRQLKNLVQNYSEAEVKVREATSNDPWGPSSSQLWKRLKDDKNWRHIHKSLTLLEYLLKTGDDRVMLKMKENIYIVKALTEYRFVEKDGKDQGVNVREKAKVVLVLMEDDEKLKEEREFAMKTREKTSKGSAASSTDNVKDPNYKPVYVPGASGLPCLDNIPSVADLTASFAARKEERLRQEAEKKETERRAKMSEDELKWEDAGKAENAAKSDPWGAAKEPSTDPWGAPAKTTKPVQSDPFGGPTTPVKEDPFSTTSKGDPFAASSSPSKDDPFTVPCSPPTEAASDPFSAPAAGSPQETADTWGAQTSSPPAKGSDAWGAPSVPKETKSADPWGDDPSVSSPLDDSDLFGDATKPDDDPWGAPASAPVSSDDAWGTPAPPSDVSPSGDPFGDGATKSNEPWGAPSNASGDGAGKRTSKEEEICRKTASFLGSTGASLVDVDDLFAPNPKTKQQPLINTLAARTQAIGKVR